MRECELLTLGVLVDRGCVFRYDGVGLRVWVPFPLRLEPVLEWIRRHETVVNEAVIMGDRLAAAGADAKLTRLYFARYLMARGIVSDG